MECRDPDGHDPSALAGCSQQACLPSTSGCEGRGRCTTTLGCPSPVICAFAHVKAQEISCQEEAAPGTGLESRPPTPAPPNDLFENGHGSRTRFPSGAIVWSPWTSLGAAQPLKQLQTETSRRPYVAGPGGSRVRAVDNAEICPTWSGHGINSESAEKSQVKFVEVQVRSILSQFPPMSSD